MKTFQATVIAMIATVTLFSCKKETAQNSHQAGAVEAYLKDETLTPETNDYSYEAGIYFYATTNGQINSFSVHLPAPGTYTVSLWDPVDLTRITSAQITNTNAAAWNDGSIQPINIKMSKIYFLTVNSKSFYHCYGPSKILPFTKGNITIAGHIAGKSSGNSIGDYGASATSLNSGFVDFTFQPKE